MSADNPLIWRHLRHEQAARRRSPSTIAAKGTALRSLAVFLAERFGAAADDPDVLLVAELADLVAWQQSLRLSDRTLACYTAHVRVFYRWAASGRGGRLLGADPAAELEIPSVPRGVPRPIADLDLFTALDIARVTDEQLHAWLMLAAGCGLRCCEIAGLQRRQVVVDEAAQTVRITVVGKGRRQRVRDGGPGVYGALRPLLDRDPMFTMLDGRPVTPAYVSERINRFLRRELGIADTAHSLRHWFGSTSYRVRRDLRAVQEAMGHASPVHTAGYVALIDGGGSGLGMDVDQVLAGRPRHLRPVAGG